MLSFLPSFLPSLLRWGPWKLWSASLGFSFLVNCLMEEDEHNDERKKERKKDRRKFWHKQKTTNALVCRGVVNKKSLFNIRLYTIDPAQSPCPHHPLPHVMDLYPVSQSKPTPSYAPSTHFWLSCGWWSLIHWVNIWWRGISAVTGCWDSMLGASTGWMFNQVTLAVEAQMLAASTGWMLN